LRADLDSLDATIRLFDPSIEPKAIKPCVKRTAVQDMSTVATASVVIANVRAALAKAA
jgi:hypothetical protein